MTCIQGSQARPHTHRHVHTLHAHCTRTNAHIHMQRTHVHTGMHTRANPCTHVQTLAHTCKPLHTHGRTISPWEESGVFWDSHGWWCCCGWQMNHWHGGHSTTVWPIYTWALISKLRNNWADSTDIWVWSLFTLLSLRNPTINLGADI